MKKPNAIDVRVGGEGGHDSGPTPKPEAQARDVSGILEHAAVVGARSAEPTQEGSPVQASALAEAQEPKMDVVMGTFKSVDPGTVEELSPNPGRVEEFQGIDQPQETVTLTPFEGAKMIGGRTAEAVRDFLDSLIVKVVGFGAAFLASAGYLGTLTYASLIAAGAWPLLASIGTLAALTMGAAAVTVVAGVMALAAAYVGGAIAGALWGAFSSKRGQKISKN